MGIEQQRPCPLADVDFHASIGLWPRFSFDLSGGHGGMESRVIEDGMLRAGVASWAGTGWLEDVGGHVEGSADLSVDVQVAFPAPRGAYHHSVAWVGIQGQLPATPPDGDYTLIAVLTSNGESTALPAAWVSYAGGEPATTCTIHGGNRTCYDSVEENVPWPLPVAIVALLALARRFS